ncbi:hypothetical protein ASE90_08890 [Sphingomonas sp. Leaf67]|uniref:hypothetical protein n=1 Tax=Sphingomonas sp. Leaf67 TaxID=1736230 RepID=UPI0006F29299|nr:hypothetical protein [Sphingomonas sp. Leaf67]KQN82880.1 hypothetical protein ASE90_08890 [Sphingomonas sp. Leaf67]
MKFKTLSIALALIATPALAHGDDKPRHGGQVVEVGETVFELVRAPAGVSLYVMEDGDEVPAAGMMGKLFVTTGAQRSEIVLTPAAKNQFVAKGAKIAVGSKVGVLLIDRKTQARQTATFAVK